MNSNLNVNVPMDHHHPGYWGPVTATLDWCEANYQFSHYVAEVSNTFSNVFFISICLCGIYFSRKESLPTRMIVGFVGCALVGLGSFLFHATLLYEAQLADELPMIYVTSFFMAMLLDTKPGYGFRSTYTKAIVAATVVFNIIFTATYLVYRNPVYHQCVFATLMISMVLRESYLLLSERSKTIPDKKKSAIVQVLRTGALSFIFGFIIWNLDNIFCDSWTRVKLAVGWPIAFFLEGHAWWHIFTGIGTFYLNQGVALLTFSVKSGHHKYRFKYWYGLPLVTHATKSDKA